jgi:hypothetical protein
VFHGFSYLPLNGKPNIRAIAHIGDLFILFEAARYSISRQRYLPASAKARSISRLCLCLKTCLAILLSPFACARFLRRNISGCRAFQPAGK